MLATDRPLSSADLQNCCTMLCHNFWFDRVMSPAAVLIEAPWLTSPQTFFHWAAHFYYQSLASSLEEKEALMSSASYFIVTEHLIHVLSRVQNNCKNGVITINKTMLTISSDQIIVKYNNNSS